MTDPVAAASAATPELSRPLVLMVWDAPNMDMGLAGLLNRQPAGNERPRFDAVGRWLLGRAGAEDDVEAVVFTNVPEHGAARISGWVKLLRSYGYGVFAKPKLGSSDVDEDMLALVTQHAGRLREVVVASGDGRAFREPLEDLAVRGINVTVLAFAEEASYAAASPTLGFVDLEDVPDAFLTPLPRTRLDALPPEGRLLPPLTPLRAALGG